MFRGPFLPILGFPTKNRQLADITYRPYTKHPSNCDEADRGMGEACCFSHVCFCQIISCSDPRLPLGSSILTYEGWRKLHVT
jgi:hypothetical protein